MSSSYDGRNSAERAAISNLFQLVRANNYSPQRQRQMCRLVVKQCVDAAMKEIRKEMQEQAANEGQRVVKEADIHEVNIEFEQQGDPKHMAAKIVAERLEKEGAILPRAQYEEGGDK